MVPLLLPDEVSRTTGAIIDVTAASWPDATNHRAKNTRRAITVSTQPRFAPSSPDTSLPLKLSSAIITADGSPVLGGLDVLLATTDKSRESAVNSPEEIPPRAARQLCLVGFASAPHSPFRPEPQRAPRRSCCAVVHAYVDFLGWERRRHVLEHDVRGPTLTTRRLEMAADRAVQSLVDASSPALHPMTPSRTQPTPDPHLLRRAEAAADHRSGGVLRPSSRSVTSMSRIEPLIGCSARALERDRGHSVLRLVRDVTFAENLSQVRTASASQIMASPRNLATSPHRLVGAFTLATTLRRHSRDPAPPPQLLKII